MSKQFYFKQLDLAYVHSFNVKTVPFQIIQFSTCIQFSSIWPIDRTLSGATTLGQSRPGSDGKKGILRIPQRSSINEPLPSNCFVSYQGTSWGVLSLWNPGKGVAPSSTHRCSSYWKGNLLVAMDYVRHISLQRCSLCILQPRIWSVKDLVLIVHIFRAKVLF